MSGQNSPHSTFYVSNKGWIGAVDLRAGDILVLQSGEYVIVELVQHEILEAPIAVYNFEVEDFHTYYVGEGSVLVHNMCGGLQKIDGSYLKKLKLDAHSVKREYMGKKAKISLYDLAVDKKTGKIYIVDKAGKIITETIYKTK